MCAMIASKPLRDSDRTAARTKLREWLPPGSVVGSVVWSVIRERTRSGRYRVDLFTLSGGAMLKLSAFAARALGYGWDRRA